MARRRSWEALGIQKTLDLRERDGRDRLSVSRYRGPRAGVVIGLPGGRRIEGCRELRLVLGPRAARQLAAALIAHAEYLEESAGEPRPADPGQAAQ